MAIRALESTNLSRRGLYQQICQQSCRQSRQQSWKIKTATFVWLLSGIMGCGSTAIKPEAKNIEVTRGQVDRDCKSIGSVEGRTISAKGTFEEALENLKLDAARKGATHVQIEATSAIGTAVRGEAYFCP